MSVHKKGKYEKKSFESMGNSSDTSANIYESMMTSPAWLSLKARPQILYVTCKSQYYSEKKKPNGNNLQFTMNKHKWCNKYKLYSNANSQAFYNDMAELIEKGFIICIECGAITRTKSIYQLCDGWRLYGTEKFSPPPFSSYTLGMLNKTRNKE